MRILFLVSAHNSLSQRTQIALTELGHEISVAVVSTALEMEAAVARHRPELIVCPMLKAIIPRSITDRHRCLIVHPGPKGDRGPSSLDWAIELGADRWGVTVLEASDEVDGGDIWASRTFRMREAGKSSLYRHEVRREAVDAVVQAVRDVAAGDVAPEPLNYSRADVFGRPRPLLTQAERAIDWTRDGTDSRAAADPRRRGPPRRARQHRRRAVPPLRRPPRDLAARPARRADRPARRRRLPRDRRRRGVDHAPEGAGLRSSSRPRGRSSSPACRASARGSGAAARGRARNWREIRYEERDGVGYLHFDFYNGAMSTDQCRRLREAYRYATRRPTAVIVLMGGRDFFSNGIHLNVIEAAEDPATESWWNLHAIDDLVRDIVETDSHLVVSALAGDAAAGGVPFALAADHVVAREDVVLNPYYRHMGGLYGSEYWTYLMPRRIGHELTEELTSAPFEPIGTRRAVEIGLLDDAFGEDVPRFRGQVRALATELAGLALPADAARGQAARAPARRAGQAALGLPHRGAGEVTRVLLRARPQLPRGAPPLRAQARRAVPRHAGAGATRGLSYSLRAGAKLAPPHLCVSGG